MSIITDTEMELKSALYEDKNIQIKLLRQALDTISYLTDFYRAHPPMHMAALSEIHRLAQKTLRETV